jgi:hypothetical protein
VKQSIITIHMNNIVLFCVDSRIRDRYFKEFLNLSLYEDMAPWNIVLNGPTLAYIDYDTRELTFNNDVAKVIITL